MFFLLAAVVAQAVEDPCPSSLVRRGDPPAIAPHTRVYIDCMTIPSMPSEDDLAERLEECASKRTRGLASAQARLAGQPRYRRNPSAAKRAAAAPFRWIDAMAANFPRCETRLVIAGDGSRTPHAEH